MIWADKYFWFLAMFFVLQFCSCLDYHTFYKFLQVLGLPEDAKVVWVSWGAVYASPTGSVGSCHGNELGWTI